MFHRIFLFETVRKSKMILLVGNFLFDSGHAQKELDNEKCPISECKLTLDANQYRRTADAIFILNLNVTVLNTLLPKPAHQVRRRIYLKPQEENRLMVLSPWHVSIRMKRSYVSLS
jgi:hypothetical protein